MLKKDGIFFIARLPRKLSYAEHLAKILRLGHHYRLYGDKEIKKLLYENSFNIIDFAFTDIVPAYPENITNIFYPFVKIASRALLRTPLKYFAHDIRLVCRNNKGMG